MAMFEYKPSTWFLPASSSSALTYIDINSRGRWGDGGGLCYPLWAYVGWMGMWVQAFSAVIALVTALAVSPLIAWATWRYYLAREPWAARGRRGASRQARSFRLRAPAHLHGVSASMKPMTWRTARPISFICSSVACLMRVARICASPMRGWRSNGVAWRVGCCLPFVWRRVDTELGQFLLLIGVLAPAMALLFGMVYQQHLRDLDVFALQSLDAWQPLCRLGFVRSMGAVACVWRGGVVAGVNSKSRKVAQEESNRQTHLLVQEIESHRVTDQKLQQAKLQADQAKSMPRRATSATSATSCASPINSILGYAQLLDEDQNLPGACAPCSRGHQARRRPFVVAHRRHAGHGSH